MFQARSLITGAAFLSSSLIGATWAFVGTSLPVMRTFLDINLEQAGLLTAMMQTGFAVSALAGGLLSDMVRSDRVLMLGCLLLSIASFLLGNWLAFWVNLTLILCMGVGVGFIVSSSNALLVELYQNRKGMILNIHHMFFGIGSLVSPLIMAYLISGPYRWQSAYIGLGCVLLVLFLFFSLTDIPESSDRGAGILGSEVAKLLTDKLYIVIILISALAIGTQLGLMLLSVTFLNEAKSFSIATASAALSLFFVFLVLGRLICSRLAMVMCNTKIILLLLFFQSATLLSAWLGAGSIAFISLALAGLACSGLYPGLLALTGALYFKVAGSALGILTTAAGLGGILVCWLNGVVSQRTSVNLGFVVLVLCSIVSLLLLVFHYKPLCRKENVIKL